MPNYPRCRVCGNFYSPKDAIYHGYNCRGRSPIIITPINNNNSQSAYDIVSPLFNKEMEYLQIKYPHISREALVNIINKELENDRENKRQNDISMIKEYIREQIRIKKNL